MKKIGLIALVGVFLMGCETESIRLDEVQKAIGVEETKNILFALASDEMKGRDSKHGGYAKAAAFAADYFQKNNIQPFYPTYRDSLMTDSLWSYNIVGSLGKYDPNKKTVLIGAHLDHIGIKTQEGDSIYNGANDNATGSTAVLQIARFLSQKKWKQNVVVALFADEEKGLKGAYHLAERMKNEQVDLAYMINFEMLGITLTTGKNQVYMTGYNLSDMPDKMNAISPNFVQFLPQAKEYNLFRRSDNYAFYEAFGVPAQTLSTFDFKNYAHYHKAGDEAEKIEIDNMNTVIGTAAYIIAKLLDGEVEIKMKEKKESPTAGFAPEKYFQKFYRHCRLQSHRGGGHGSVHGRADVGIPGGVIVRQTRHSCREFPALCRKKKKPESSWPPSLTDATIRLD